VSNRLYDAVSRIARHAAEAREIAAFGVVSEVYHDVAGLPDHAVDLELRDRGLVLSKVPVAVGALGVTAAPAVGDLAMVVFGDGDLHAPVVLGFLHNSDVPAPALGPEQATFAFPPGSASPAAHALLDYANPSFLLKIGAKTQVEFASDVITITAGGATVEIDAGGSEEIRMSSGGAKVTMTSGGDVEVSANGKMVFDAAEIEMNAKGSFKVSAAKVDLN
jgi:phage baseplate assembly protein gpV